MPTKKKQRMKETKKLGLPRCFVMWFKKKSKKEKQVQVVTNAVPNPPTSAGVGGGQGGTEMGIYGRRDRERECLSKEKNKQIRVVGAAFCNHCPCRKSTQAMAVVMRVLLLCICGSMLCCMHAWGFVCVRCLMLLLPLSPGGSTSTLKALKAKIYAQLKVLGLASLLSMPRLRMENVTRPQGDSRKERGTNALETIELFYPFHWLLGLRGGHCVPKVLRHPC